MIDYDPTYSYDQDEGHWRNIALIAAVGIGAFVAYRYLSRSGAGADLGDKLRRGVQQVKDQVACWTHQGEQSSFSQGQAGAGASATGQAGFAKQGLGDDYLSGGERAQVDADAYNANPIT